ncbi:MAG: hypothetical protein KR126chlam4_00146 [Candidatus Anoxychlamydiales bacterium]|nr:hypothetical protein [Candidatus Anoxychlamydiales bacterium]NGX40329.1 hypothetical protein [Candidatus Anoxychlamydiales bacterium]
MQEITQIRKNKICLLDYDYKQDIENRVMLSKLTEFELSILEEILYSSIKTSLSRLSKDLETSEKKLLSVLEKFEKANLLKIDGEIIDIDKKMRKYFEFEYQRFEENFKPDLLFINNLLHKIPIHILPIWYSIPKSSNNIFASIIDKYLLTPQIFQRHLENIECENSTFLGIVEDVYNSENFEVTSADLQKKYSLEKETYLEIILLLEFNLLCFQSYKKTKNGYVEIITPFHEYKDYLQYLNQTKTLSIKDTKKLIRKRKNPFGFAEDLCSVLKMAKKPLSKATVEKNIKIELSIKDSAIIVSKSYIDSIINKLLKIEFLSQKKDLLQTTISGKKWLDFNLENKALHLYYHTLNTLDEEESFKHLINEKSIREAEKSIIRVLDSTWVYFDDFSKGIIAAITDEHLVKIKHSGKAYKYSIASYSKEEILFIKKIIFERLFEAGFVSVGSLNGRDCFSVTKLGQKLFEIS